MQTIKQIALCAVCAFIFGACDSNVDSKDSSDSNQNQSNATNLEQSQSDESKSTIDSSPISLDEVYVNTSEKPLQIISEQIDFWGKGFFLEWCEGFERNGVYVSCGEYITNGKDGGVVGVRIFDKARGVMISDGARNDKALSQQKVLSAEFENGIWTLMLDKDINGSEGDSAIKFRFLRDEFGKIYAQHIYGDKRSVPLYVRDFTYTPSDELPSEYSGKWVLLENPKVENGKVHDCVPLEAYKNATLPKDKLPCFSAYKWAVANFDMGFDGFDRVIIDKIEISEYRHDADFPTQSPIIFEKIKDGVSFIQTIGTTLGLYSAGATSMRFIDKNKQMAYFHNEIESPFVRENDLKTLGIHIYSVIYDKDGNEIYNKSE